MLAVSADGLELTKHAYSKSGTGGISGSGYKLVIKPEKDVTFTPIWWNIGRTVTYDSSRGVKSGNSSYSMKDGAKSFTGNTANYPNLLQGMKHPVRAFTFKDADSKYSNTSYFRLYYYKTDGTYIDYDYTILETIRVEVRHMESGKTDHKTSGTTEYKWGYDLSGKTGTDKCTQFSRTVTTCEYCTYTSNGSWTATKQITHGSISKETSEWKEFMDEFSIQHYRIQTSYCSRCSTVTEEKIVDLGSHNYSDYVKKDETYHERTCETCGKKEESTHSYGKMLWKVEGLMHIGTEACTVCGHAKTEKHRIMQDPNGLSAMEEPGTCVSNGTKYVVCKECGLSATIITSMNPSNHESYQTRTIQEPTCQKKGSYEKWCTACNKKVSSWETNKASSCSMLQHEIPEGATQLTKSEWQQIINKNNDFSARYPSPAIYYYNNVIVAESAFTCNNAYFMPIYQGGEYKCRWCGKINKENETLYSTLVFGQPQKHTVSKSYTMTQTYGNWYYGYVTYATTYGWCDNCGKKVYATYQQGVGTMLTYLGWSTIN